MLSPTYAHAITDILNSSTYDALVNRKQGEWLEVDSQGRFYIVAGFVQKIWYMLRNFFSCSSLQSRLAATIDATCRNLFFAIVKTSPAPLDSESPVIRQFTPYIERLVTSIKKLRPSLYNANVVKDLKDLTRQPEVAEAKFALSQGKKPQLLAEGISGSYILVNRKGDPLAIFKPAEEEAGNPANPKGFSEKIAHGILRQFRITPGTSYQRERVAYLLDKDHFSQVPATFIAHMPRKYFSKFGTFEEDSLIKGSFQKFILGCKEAWDYYQILPSFLSSASGHKIPSHEIHKIAILDIRMLNCDRHMKNFLIDNDWHAHPIDHGYTLPGNASNLRFNWMNFTQAKAPFSQEALNYIHRLDPDSDIALIKRKVPSLDSAALFRVKVATLLLKKAAAKGLSAYQIGALMIGSHPESLMSLLNHFLPIATGRSSYFEINICQPLLTRHVDIDTFLTREIEKIC